MWLPTPSGYCAWCLLVPGTLVVLRRNVNFGLTGGVLVSRLPICESCAEERRRGQSPIGDSA